MTLPALPGYLNRYVDGRTHSLDAVVVDKSFVWKLDDMMRAGQLRAFVLPKI